MGLIRIYHWLIRPSINLGGLFLLLISSSVFADEILLNTYNVSTDFPSGNGTHNALNSIYNGVGLSEAHEACVARGLEPDPPDSGQYWVCGSPNGFGGFNQTSVQLCVYTDSNDGSVTVYNKYDFDPIGCPSVIAPSCPESGAYGFEQYTDSSVPDQYQCVSSCEYVITNQVDLGQNINGPDPDLISIYSSTGQECENGNYNTGNDNDSDIEELPTGDVYEFQEIEFNFDPTQENCGTINGEDICFDIIQEDECTSLPDGTTLCGDLAVSPEAPDTGTPLQEAQPDISITNTETNETVNVFNTTTVNNSTTSSPDNDTGDTSQAQYCSDNPNAAICDSSGTPVVVDNSDVVAELNSMQQTLDDIRENTQIYESAIPATSTYDIDDLTNETADQAIKDTLGIDSDVTYDDNAARIETAVSRLIGDDGSGGSCDVSTTLNSGVLLGTIEFPFCDYEWIFIMLGNMVYALGVLGAWIGVSRSLN